MIPQAQLSPNIQRSFPYNDCITPNNVTMFLPVHLNSPHVIPPDALNHLVHREFSTMPPAFCFCPAKLASTNLTIQHASRPRDKSSCASHHQRNYLQVQNILVKSLVASHKMMAKQTLLTQTPSYFWIMMAGIKCIPKDRVVTYTHIVVDYLPQKTDPNQV